MATPCGAAKFREETSKKADSAIKDRIAAMHNLGDRSLVCKRFFALQHCFLQRVRLPAEGSPGNPLLTLGLYDAGHAVFRLVSWWFFCGPSEPRCGPSPSRCRRPAQGCLCRAAVGCRRAEQMAFRRICSRAISRVESGRRDPVTGDWHPWPWTVDAEGQGAFYDTKAQAIAAVQACKHAGCSRSMLVAHRSI